jgi:hypothetical protein
MNTSFYGSPVIVTSTMLDMGFGELSRLLLDHFNQAKGGDQPPLCSNGGGV